MKKRIAKLARTTTRIVSGSRAAHLVDALHTQEAVQQDLLRVAAMFKEYRHDPIMRELARIAIRSAQERWTSV